MALKNAYQLSTVIKTQVGGGQVMAIAGTFETEATDDTASIYRLCKVGADWVPISMELNNDAIAGATDIDVGLYETLEMGGAVKDADIFLNGEDINTGHALGSEQDAMEDMGVANIGKQIYELAGDTTPEDQRVYDLAITTNAAITGAGTIAFRALFAKTA